MDDGTGVIICKLSEDQFEKAISVIEREQEGIFNETIKFKKNIDSSFNHSCATDVSMDDSIFNDKTVQEDELNAVKLNVLKVKKLLLDNI